MKFEVITLFPEMFEAPLKCGVVGQAAAKKIIQVNTHNPRSYTTDVHKTVDDRPFGGGDGMVMLASPVEQALAAALKTATETETVTAPLRARRIIYLSPQGAPLTHALAHELSSLDELVLICGRYGGIDQRFLSKYVDQEISIGDYVLSGGELAALVLIDAVARFLPGVLGNELSPQEESFANGLLEAPQFTRPREYQGTEVPEVLLSGNHAKISRWRYLVSLLRTRKQRPDLFAKANVPQKDMTEAEALERSLDPRQLEAYGLSRAKELPKASKEK
jgi:tRNA (guanine37-N1)-methyltransferase